MSEHKSEYMSEDDYTTLIASIQSGLRNAESVTKQEAVDPGPLYRLAVRVARGIREEFELTRKPDPLPDAPGTVISVPMDERWSSLYVRARNGEWHVSPGGVSAEWLSRHTAGHGFEVVV